MPILSDELDRAQRLPLNYYDVLVQLAQAKGRQMRLKELNERVVLSQPALSRLVERMATAGLVRRQAAQSDRRGTLVCMTHEGLTALRRAAPVHLAGIERHFARHMTDEEARVLDEVLQRVRQAAAKR